MPSTGAWQGASTRPDAIYVVKSGDSLSKISQLFYYNVSQEAGVARIAAANNLDPVKPIQIGQRLKIPGGGSLDPASPNDSAATSIRKESTPVATVRAGFPALDLHDWRVWAGGGLLLFAGYLLWRGSHRR